MDLQAALQAGALVMDAYSGYDNHLPNYDEKTYQGFAVIQTIYTNNLATRISPRFDPLCDIVPIGFVGQSTLVPTEYVIAIRGTEGIWQWVQDLNLLPGTFSSVSGSGLTEDGFTEMYNSFRVAPDPSSTRLVPSLPAKLGSNVTKLTICGHSLGSSLATLLALDVIVNTPYKQAKLITFASPRTGDLHFANYFNAAVPDCYRIANRMDIVTHLPTPPLYVHVGDTTELNPGGVVHNNLVCQHDMATYMHLLSNGSIGLTPSCAQASQVAAAPLLAPAAIG